MTLAPVIQCLICGDGFGTLQKTVNPAERYGITRDLTMYYYLCANCGSEFGDKESTDENARIAREIYRRIL